MSPVDGLPGAKATADSGVSMAFAAVPVEGGVLAVSLTGDTITAATASAVLKAAFDVVHRR
ncbi:hypothetical protein EF294_21250 [Gordonia oryzae]|uniref:Uncharacterized protein n=1 Tax=Gordonia oryzae TaxID=2487349 RepID=A0A3N4G084_9ACTN|nr:hypothetical protein [Gordonia oryzae]RPA56362.1 hypothetical protein EF294_21250 [Gordonia oryzae]